MTRCTHASFVLTTILLTVALLDAAYGTVFAQGKLDARYSVTLAGLSIGRGSWVINIGEDEFSATANGTTASLAHVFASGQGYSSVHGTIAAGQLAPAVYTTSIRTGQVAPYRFSLPTPLGAGIMQADQFVSTPQ